MSETSLAIIAGKGAYPLDLARSARNQGIQHLMAVAFRGETDKRLTSLVDDIHWIRVGELQALLDRLKNSGCATAVMAGQITPTNLFNVRFDARMKSLLSRLTERNAHTIFAAVADEISSIGMELAPAHLYMESSMPGTGCLTSRKPDEREQRDISLGLQVARTTSGLEIGQTVVIKEGTIVAVEAFEGTDETIRRAGRLAGSGSVIVKVAKKGHDMRFDIPVVGARTIQSLRKAKASALAFQSGHCIILEQESVIREADSAGISLIGVELESGDTNG